VSVELRRVGLLDQSLRVELCASNPNEQDFAFRQIAVALDVADEPLAEGVSDSAVLLLPHQSVLVPFEVATTTRNIAPQLLAILVAGAVEYRVHGSVQLAGSLGITVPFSHQGRLDILSAGPALLAVAGQALLADRAAPGDAGCGRSGFDLRPSRGEAPATFLFAKGGVHE